MPTSSCRENPDPVNGAPVSAFDLRNGVVNWIQATSNLTSNWVVSDAADVFNTGHADLIVQQQSTGTTVYAQEGASGFAGWGLVSNGLNSHFHAV